MNHATQAVGELNHASSDKKLGGVSVGIGKVNNKYEQYNWFYARTMYKINSAAASSSFQAVFMGAVGVVHAILFGILFALIFPKSVLLGPGLASGDSEDPEAVLHADNEWNHLPDWGSLNNIPEGIWNVWLWMADTGHQGNAVGLVERLFALYVTMFGILYFSCIIGLIVEEVVQQMEALRRGKTGVVEEDHVVMLGWTDKSLLFIKEIILANESEGGGIVVILSEEEKEFLEQQVRHHFQGRMGGTKVVIRNGSRLNSPDLAKMSIGSCKSVIVLSNVDLAPNNADSEVMQVVLAMSSQERRGHIVAEVRDVDNEKLVKTMNGDSGPPIETVVSHDIIGRLMLMCVRFPGLAAAYDKLLGFEGSEFYVEKWPQLEGYTFKELQCRFPDAVPIGVRNAAGKTTLNPPLNFIMRADDELVVFAMDNDTYKPEEPPPGFIADFAHAGDKFVIAERKPEIMLFCGWRRDLRDMIMLLDSMVTRGSHLHILSTISIRERNKQLGEGGLDFSKVKNITIVHMFGNPAVQRHLEQVPIELYSSCLLLSDAECSIMQSDSTVLATLVLVRSLQMRRMTEAEKIEPDEKLRLEHLDEDRTAYMNSVIPTNMTRGNPPKEKKVRHSSIGLVVEEEEAVDLDLWGNAEKLQVMPIVCEILDPRTQTTIQGNEKFASVSDFLQSNDMVGKILAMVGEDIRVKGILDELLEANRSQIEIGKPSTYMRLDQKSSFMDVALKTRMHHTTLIGFFDFDPEGDGEGAFVPLINPGYKSTPRRWNDKNLLILITSSADHQLSPDGDVEQSNNNNDDGKISMDHVNFEDYRLDNDGPTGGMLDEFVEQKNSTLDQIHSRLEHLSDTLARSLTLNEYLYQALQQQKETDATTDATGAM